jgi:hypothetical protein
VAKGSRDPLSVFVNAPFDDEYDPLFEALVFTITACGYHARCALEVDDNGDIRLEKLDRLVRESPRSIHDLPPIELGENELPHFNMLFELGLALGAKRFGGKLHKNDRIKIMVDKPYRLPAYLSDLGGNDPSAHNREPHQIIRIVRDFLQQKPEGGILPGPEKLIQMFGACRAALPEIARAMEHEPNEIGVRKNYVTFLSCISEFLKPFARNPVQNQFEILKCAAY